MNMRAKNIYKYFCSEKYTVAFVENKSHNFMWSSDNINYIDIIVSQSPKIYVLFSSVGCSFLAEFTR